MQLVSDNLCDMTTAASLNSLRGAEKVTSMMDDALATSLLSLYDVAWVKQDQKRLFEPLDITRDQRFTRSSIKTPQNLLKLSWSDMLMKVSAILVRSEYRDMLRDIVKFAVVGEERPNQESDDKVDVDGDDDSDSDVPFRNYVADVSVDHPPVLQGATVTGSPGVGKAFLNIVTGASSHPISGKTLFLYYVLVLCLLAQRPAVFQRHPDELYVFNDEGIFQIPFARARESLSRYLARGTWFFVDSNANLPAVPEEYDDWCLMCSGFILQAALPRPAYSDWLDKASRTIMRFWMAPWTLEEIIAARGCQKLVQSMPSEKDLATFVELYGPCPRFAYAYANQQGLYARSVSIAWLSRESFEDMARCACGISAEDSLSEKIFMRYPVQRNRTLSFSQIPTRHLFDILLEGLKKYDDQASAFLYRFFIENSRLRANAKYLLQRAVQFRFSDGGQWPATIMKKDNGRWRLDKGASHLNIRFGSRGALVKISSTLNNAPLGRFTCLKLHVFDIEQEPNLILQDGLYVHRTWDLDAFVYDAKTNTATILRIAVWKNQRVKAMQLDWLRNHGANYIDLIAVTPPVEEDSDEYYIGIERFNDVNIYVSPTYASAIRNVYHLAISEGDVL